MTHTYTYTVKAARQKAVSRKVQARYIHNNDDNNDNDCNNNNNNNNNVPSKPPDRRQFPERCRQDIALLWASIVVCLKTPSRHAPLSFESWTLFKSSRSRLPRSSGDWTWLTRTGGPAPAICGTGVGEEARGGGGGLAVGEPFTPRTSASSLSPGPVSARTCVCVCVCVCVIRMYARIYTYHVLIKSSHSSSPCNHMEKN